MARQNGRSDNEGMAEFAKQLWERYMRQRVTTDLLKHSLDGYKAQVVSNNGDGTLTVIRPYDAQAVTLRCPPALATWADENTQVLVVSLGDASNSFILCATNIDGFDTGNLSNQNPLMDAANASPGTANAASRADHVHPSDTSRVPTSRTINGYDLTQDRTLTAADVGALEATAPAVSAKSLYAVNVISFSTGDTGWYKFYEQNCDTNNRSYGMVLLITSGYGTGAGLLRVYIARSSTGTISPSVRWLATNYSLGSVRWELSGTVVKLYINVTQGSRYIRALSFSGRSPNVTYDPTEYWTNTEVEEPTNATAAEGTITNYAARATSDGAGNNIADGRLWFEAQAVSAGTAQQILSISDAKITADYVLARIEFADPSYITTGYSWATASGSFTLTGTATAATTANVLLVRKGN